MTLIAFSKRFVRPFLLRYVGWNALSLALLLIVSVALWQLSIAGREQSPLLLSSATKHSSSSGNLVTSSAVRSATDAPLREPYDLALIDADPSYYQRVDALRLHQKDHIPDGQKRHEEIRIVGEAYRLALPHNWLEQPLVVLAKPGRPVTFVALDSGKFPNDEISITVKADGSGLASTSFFVTNEGRYRVLAGSPENSGPAAFFVHCMSQTTRDDVHSGRYAEWYLAEVKANKKRQAAAAAELVERIRQRRARN